MTGPDGGTYSQEDNNGPNLGGKPNETTVFLDNIEVQSLLDTGSCISSIGQSFYEKNLSHLPLHPVSEILKVECADGEQLSYLGLIKTVLTSPGIPNCEEQPCLFLIVPDTSYNLKVPVLIGTNILDEIAEKYKTAHGERYLQTGNFQTPWYLSLRCLAIRQRELKKNKNSIAIVRCAETSRIIIGPNQTVNVKGSLDRKLEFNPTCALIQECQESSLPDFIDVTPSVIQYNYKENNEVNVSLSNLTTNSVTISPKEVLCEVQPVTVDESVFDKIENESTKKIFEEIHIDSKLPSEQRERVEALLKKHVDVFSKTDTDIGDCDFIKHRIDLIDDTPFKQRHRRIPPAMIDEVRKHIEELLSNGVNYLVFFPILSRRHDEDADDKWINIRWGQGQVETLEEAREVSDHTETVLNELKPVLESLKREKNDATAVFGSHVWISNYELKKKHKFRAFKEEDCHGLHTQYVKCTGTGNGIQLIRGIVTTLHSYFHGGRSHKRSRCEENILHTHLY